MPGHVKKTSGPDPDPSPWLEVKEHIREEQKKKAYDPKKSVWVPNADKEVGGYFEGICSEEIKYDTFAPGKKLTVAVNGENKVYKSDAGDFDTFYIFFNSELNLPFCSLPGQPPQI